MKVLVTGGAGFIGSHIVEYFQHSVEVIILDNFRTGCRENLKNMQCHIIEGDIRDRSILKKAMTNIDFVFHAAAMVSVPESMEQITQCIDVNSTGSVMVMQEAVNAGVKKLCFCSSCSIYGNNPLVPKIETMFPEPQSPYAVSKLDGEYYADIFSKQGDLKTVSLRYFNVFGPRQNPDSQYAAAVPIFIKNAIQNKPLTIFGNGEQTRDFVYVKDVVAANVFMSQNDYNGVFNVGYGNSITIKELAKKIISLTNSNSEIIFRPERIGDVMHSTASIDKLLSTGFKPSYSFDKALKDTIQWTLNNYF